MIRLFGAAVALAALCPPALAHVSLETSEAAAGSSFKAVFRVPHGCDGAPTVRLTVRVPAQILNSKPQPKPGWDLAMKKEGGVVREISWSGGTLGDDLYDEFVVHLVVPDSPGSVLRFAVKQGCAPGEENWTSELRVAPGVSHHHHP